MITCPDCRHQNPDATYCEVCEAPLAATTLWPNYGGLAQPNARFCVHSDIRLEGDTYFIDIDNANGTYINHTVLPTGNRHRLRHGDRIALGKGDLVTFLFQLHSLRSCMKAALVR